METQNTAIKFIVGGVILFLILIFLIAFFPIVVIGAGQRGVVFNNFSGVENRILGEGTHTRIPFVESVIQMPVQTQVASFDESGANSAGTQDSQQVDLQLTVNWRLDPAKINNVYQNIGNTDAVISNVLNPNVRDAIKQAISKYQALDVQKNRDAVGQKALAILQSKMKTYHVIVDNLSITNINFSAQFNQAVEDAQVQQQKAKAAEYAVQTAKNNANAAIATAQGQSQAQQLLQQALTPELLQKMWIDKWDGRVPTYDGTGSTLFQIPGK